jgi:hypothetical protein
MATDFVEEIDGATSFRFADEEKVLIEFTVGGRVRRYKMRMRPFRESIRGANQMADAWAEKHPCEVVSLSGRKRRA